VVPLAISDRINIVPHILAFQSLHLIHVSLYLGFGLGARLNYSTFSPQSIHVLLAVSPVSSEPAKGILRATLILSAYSTQIAYCIHPKGIRFYKSIHFPLILFKISLVLTMTFSLNS